MKIIKEGNTITTCCRCGCVFEWDKSDLKNARGFKYLICPYCGEYLTID